MPEASSRQYRHSDHTEASQVGDRIVLYHRDSRKALVLNPTGSWVWNLLAIPQMMPALAEQLQARFPSLTWEQAFGDVSGFLQDLHQHGMVRLEE